MVSSDEMEGLRERIDVGVDGTDEDASDHGYCSLNLEGASRGEEAAEVGVLTVGVLVGGAPNGVRTWWRGEAGRRRRDSEPVLLYRPATPPTALGVSSNSASSEMSHTLGEPSKEPSEAGRMPEPMRSWEAAARSRGLRVRLGDRSGDEGRLSGSGEGDSMGCAGCMMVGSECARIMGGAVLGELEPLWERRWEREKGERVRDGGRYMADTSDEGSVWERGVVGRRDERLSSDVLLSWRTSVLASYRPSASSGRSGRHCLLPDGADMKGASSVME